MCWYVEKKDTDIFKWEIYKKKLHFLFSFCVWLKGVVQNNNNTQEKCKMRRWQRCVRTNKTIKTDVTTTLRQEREPGLWGVVLLYFFLAFVEWYILWMGKTTTFEKGGKINRTFFSIESRKEVQIVWVMKGWGGGEKSVCKWVIKRKKKRTLNRESKEWNIKNNGETQNKKKKTPKKKKPCKEW